MAAGATARRLSGNGGRNLYYSLNLAPGKYTRVVAAPINHQEDAVVRVLTDCTATTSESSARGGGITNGAAVLCLGNPGASAREVVIGVGRYSGEANDLTVAFDLSVELRDPGQGFTP